MPRPRVHALASLGLAVFVVHRSGRLADALPIMGAGVLVDLDHLVDLAVARWRGVADREIMPLHGWEWVCLLLASGRRGLRLVAAGLALHLVLDQHNPIVGHPLFYSFTIRAGTRFSGERLLIPGGVERSREWMDAGPLGWL